MPDPNHSGPTLPGEVKSYGRTPQFTEKAVPSALLADHDTKPGTWGLIHVADGQLRYHITDPRRPATQQLLVAGGPPGVVEPTIRHHVEPIGTVSFHVEFLR